MRSRAPGATKGKTEFWDLSSVYQFDFDSVGLIVPIVETAVPHEPQLCEAPRAGSVARAVNVDQSYRKRNAY